MVAPVVVADAAPEGTAAVSVRGRWSGKAAVVCACVHHAVRGTSSRTRVLGVGKGAAGLSAAGVLKYCPPVPVGAPSFGAYLNVGWLSVLEVDHPKLLAGAIGH